ncbi:SDR family oxidoreductase, partial [Staphylococcus aureus]
DDAGKTVRENQKWMSPVGRLGKQEEVAELVVVLASDDGSFITGERMRIEGGVMVYTWPGGMLGDDSWKRTLE